MISKDQYSRRIADYLLGDMTQEERISFEKDLLLDPDLDFEFKRQTPIVEHLKSKALLEEIENSPDMEEAERVVQEFFRAKEKKEPDPEAPEKTDNRKDSIQLSSGSKLKKRILVPLISAAAILVGALIIWNVGIGNQEDRLYSKYYEPMDGTGFSIRGDNGEVYQEFRDALDHYMDEDYTNSAILFQQIDENSPGFMEGRLYLGLSLMGANKHELAASKFEDYLSRFNKYVPEAKWYLGLCYLHLDKLPEAKPIFEDLSGETGIVGTNSTVIAERLKRVN